MQKLRDVGYKGVQKWYQKVCASIFLYVYAQITMFKFVGQFFGGGCFTSDH
jgi:hypothetical protein